MFGDHVGCSGSAVFRILARPLHAPAVAIGRCNQRLCKRSRSEVRPEVEAEEPLVAWHRGQVTQHERVGSEHRPVHRSSARDRESAIAAPQPDQIFVEPAMLDVTVVFSPIED